MDLKSLSLNTLRFERELARGQLVSPFTIELDLGGYWLTRLASRPVTEGMANSGTG